MRRRTALVMGVLACITLGIPAGVRSEAPQTAGGQPVHLLGFDITSPAVRHVLARPTLSRALEPVRFLGQQDHEEFLLDHLPLLAALARHVHPGLEPYRITEMAPGLYEVDDHGSIHGLLHRVAVAPGRRVYVAEGEFRSRAELIKFKGAIVITLRFEEEPPGSRRLRNEPQLHLRIDNVVVHGLLRVLSPLLNRIIDRRVANLTAAAEFLSGRLMTDPGGVDREMNDWPDVTSEERAAFRRHFGLDTPHSSPLAPHR